MSKLTHVDAEGRAKMVDVTAKPETHRVATAGGTIRMKAATLDAIRGHMMEKGDVIGVARVAGIMAAKRTAELIPLCHPLPIHDVDLVLTLDAALPGVRVLATTQTVARTGVEMEALTAVSVALLTIYDMAKAIDREMVIGDIVLLAKTGGKSGPWSRLDGTAVAP
jgi:cyclic pyranopterin monophosphate synthase